MLADEVAILQETHTSADIMDSYGKEQEKLHQDYDMPVRTYATGRKKLVRESEKAKVTFASAKERLHRDFIDARLTYTSNHVKQFGC